MLPKPEDLKTSQKGAILVLLPLCMSSIILLIMSGLLIRAQEQAKREAYIESILFHQQMIDALLADSLSEAYNAALMRTVKRENPFPAIRKDMDEQFKILRNLVKDDPSLTKQIKEMQENAYRGFELANSVQSGVMSTDWLPFEVQAVANRGRKFHDEEYAQRQLFAKELRARQKSNDLISSDQWSLVILLFLTFGVILNLVISIAIGLFFGRSMSKRLQVLVDNSIRFAAGQPLHPNVTGLDEIAQLDNVFHKMTSDLRVAQRKEKAIVENSMDVICSIDQSDRFTAINNASSKVWQYEPDELLGRHLADIVSKEDISASRESMHSSQHSQNESKFENRIRRKDGTNVDMLWSAFWSRPQKSFFCVAHDITERRQQEDILLESEKRLRLILQSMPVGIVIANDHGQIETTNAKMAEMLDCSDTELTGKPLRAFFPAYSNERDEDVIDRIQENSTHGFVELDVQRKDGTTFPGQLAVSHFFIHGEIKPLVVVADIRLRREVERMKQELVAMVSHDLKAPLTTLVITLQLLKNGTLGELNDKGITRVSAMEQEVERLIGLIGNLLDLDKLESTGAVSIRKEVVSFDAIVSQSLMSVGYLAEKNGIQIDCNIEPCEAFADSAGLVQVLVNLLANAIKFSPQGSTITVFVEELDNGVKVSVKDQGRGIPEANIASIFDRFKQVERKDRKKGTGLGLAICKSIVEAHDGEIGVESEEGSGSTFWFTIPVED